MFVSLSLIINQLLICFPSFHSIPYYETMSVASNYVPAPTFFPTPLFFTNPNLLNLHIVRKKSAFQILYDSRIQIKNRE